VENGLSVMANKLSAVENEPSGTANTVSAGENDPFAMENEASTVKNSLFATENRVFAMENKPLSTINKPAAWTAGRKKEINMADWLPSTREGQLNMAKVWHSVIGIRGLGWGIPPATVQELQAAANEAEIALQNAQSSDRTPTLTAECQRIFGVLVEKMRFVKDRYFKTPPLVEEDYTALLLKKPDTTRSPRGTPKAQMTAEIGRSGTAMLILHYKYAEGTESLADPHTNIRYQVRYGVLPPPGILLAGTDLTKIPTEAVELPIVFATKRKKDIINFDPNELRKDRLLRYTHRKRYRRS
jgi:hypothetical protein